MNLTTQFLETREDNALNNLRKADLFWSALRAGEINSAEVITKDRETLETIDCDLVICGGTLGILLGSVLQKLGIKTILVERGLLKGREQEWNISLDELKVFCELELLTEAELERAVATKYNPGRIGFLGGNDIWVKDVLNIGVDPVYLLDKLKQKFLDAGGILLENTAFESANITDNGVVVKTDRRRNYNSFIN